VDANTLVNFGLVLLFVLIGGVFAATEIAMISLREGQLDQLAEGGKRGRKVAALGRNPNRFLAAVQIGVTFAGFLSAAYGASTIAPDIAPILQDAGLPEAVAGTVALVGMTIIIAYLSLVLGELAPKRLALQRAAGLAVIVGPPLDRFATVMRPVIWLLSKSTDVVVRVLGGDPQAQRETMSHEELQELVSGHEALGDEERRILGDVFSAGDRQLREVMRPRTEVDFLEADLAVEQGIVRAKALAHSRYPVTAGSVDDVVGFVHVRDLFDPDNSGVGRTVGSLARDIVRIPATNRVLPMMSELRRLGVHIAVVVDEYGGTDGIVTLEDLVEELVGEIKDEYDPDSEAEQHHVHDDATDVAGLLNLDDFAEKTGIELAEGDYETVAGYVIAVLGRMPEGGDAVEVEGRRLEVTAMDGMRISTLHLSEPVPETGPEAMKDSTQETP